MAAFNHQFSASDNLFDLHPFEIGYDQNIGITAGHQNSDFCVHAPVTGIVDGSHLISDRDGHSVGNCLPNFVIHAAPSEEISGSAIVDAETDPRPVAKR